MIRFRNPVSDISILINNFQKMYKEFSELEFFTLDHIAEFFAKERLASSSGYIGKEALKRSYQIKDDSRKSMKMQAKSYAEIYRLLGWITSNGKALNFTFTFVGMHVALFENGAKSLFAQCLLGVQYPNNILDVKFSDINKPFVNMINFAGELDNKIHRDEILLGPMNLTDGYCEKEKEDKINFIKQLRATNDANELENAIYNLARNNGMAINSVRNLTRFVISGLEYTGWFEKKKLSVYGKRMSFLALTEQGKEISSIIQRVPNINGNDLNINSFECKLISRIGILSMFKWANFDVAQPLEQCRKLIERLKIDCISTEVLFSPFQYYSKDELKLILPQYILEGGIRHKSVNIICDYYVSSENKDIVVTAKKQNINRLIDSKNKMLIYLENAKFNLEEAIRSLMDDVVTMKHFEFYPLVADLMSIVFKREAYAPPAGNNNMRYDVIVPDNHFSVPVEVKSPTEEEMLSVKAIRQALENKVLLLAREPHITTFEMSSFAIGYKIPNTRSDVYKLIDDIYETFKINIVILDIESLIRVALDCCMHQKYYDLADFLNKRGVATFESI